MTARPPCGRRRARSSSGKPTVGLLFIEPADGTINPAAERPHGTNAIDSARSGLTGDLLVTADYRGGTAVWDVATRRLLGTVDLPTEPENYTPQAWVSPDGRYAAAMHSRGGPVIFDLITRRVLRHLPPLAPPEAQIEVSVLGWTRTDIPSLSPDKCRSRPPTYSSSTPPAARSECG